MNRCCYNVQIGFDADYKKYNPNKRCDIIIIKFSKQIVNNCLDDIKNYTHHVKYTNNYCKYCNSNHDMSNKNMCNEKI